jgi:hypothetical protein
VKLQLARLFGTRQKGNEAGRDQSKKQETIKTHEKREKSLNKFVIILHRGYHSEGNF